MCTWDWAALETIDHFMRNGSDVYTITTDMSKAFDMVVHSKMFLKMLSRYKIPAIYIRLLITVYRNQESNVRWENETSKNFTVKNGTGQGRVLAAIVYCLYMEELFVRLKKNKSGCWINGEYCGIFGYSDDNWGIAPSLNALQDMTTTMEEYATEHNLKFSTDPVPNKCKTKTMAFLHKEKQLRNIILCGNPLPWVNSFKHLGTTVTNQINGCKKDMEIKNARYIEKHNQLMQEFYWADPDTITLINNIYNSHFYGSNCWDIFSEGSDRLEATWNRSVKITYNLPWETHRSCIPIISKVWHVKQLLMTRMFNFILKLRESNKRIIKVLLDVTKKNTLSVTGRNLRRILLMAIKMII